MKGIYCLIINVKKDICIRVGALGDISFAEGRYVYVGSAQNNLEKRVQRHLSRNKKIRWHIDYLLANRYVQVEQVLYKNMAKEGECRTARLLAREGSPVKRFGSSDCGCSSHLFKVMSLKTLNRAQWKEI